MVTISHHGAIKGVTGSCHQMSLASGDAVLIDCGMFQGDEARGHELGGSQSISQIDFPLQNIRGLVVTHTHIDHVGRIPYLLAAGFDAPRDHQRLPADRTTTDDDRLQLLFEPRRPRGHATGGNAR